MRISTVFSARGIIALAVICAALPSPAAAQEPSQEKKEHVVRKGDTLWDIARAYLANPFRWPLIFEANRNVVENPHWIYPAERLVIPPIPVDTLLGRVIEIETPPSAKTRFYAGRDTSSQSTLISSERVRPTIVTSYEWMSSPWIADSAALGVLGLIIRPEDPRDSHDKLAQNFHPRDRLFVTGNFNKGDQVLAIRLTRNLRGYGWIVEPMGILRVDSLGTGTALTMVSKQFSDLKVGNLLIPLPTVPTLPLPDMTDVTGGPIGQVIEFLVRQEIYSSTDYGFVDLGSAQGLSIGDELMAYIPAHRINEKSSESLPDQPVGRFRVIKVGDRTATVRVINLNNSALRPGMSVRVIKKAP